MKLIQAFDDWWEAQPEKIPTKRARENARLAFLAGCKAATTKNSYRFQSGRWVVTVSASTFAEAQRLALQRLDQRAEKFMASRPPQGWQIRQISS
ncbi:hypothetical protein JZX87_13800 [Agrobacterium sp. Ap1]|uniref:hypothetical protein n=1 Tax=Agrobacterium sp. Ap1 TaxID=2815337 RepID=UPI001A8D6D0D|nr:hypothetical protein [Agrobacterium sp. Ap1]MBO0142236.1 hypothetical protein [Agrobacterium sp. Ap1]